MRSVEDVDAFVKDQVSSGVLYTCSSCKTPKLADQFYTKRDYNKIYVAKTRCKPCERSYQVEKKFKVSKEQYAALLTEQNHCCAICGISQDDYSKAGYRDNFSVDHHHSSGKVRGLLCDKCNRGLGFFKEDISSLQAAITYLLNHDIV